MPEEIPQPPPKIEYGTGLELRFEPVQNILWISVKPSVLHIVEVAPEIGLGSDRDHARNNTTGEVWVNCAGQWITLNGPRP